MKTFKRSAAERDISFYHNFDILMIFCIVFLVFLIADLTVFFIRFLNVIVNENSCAIYFNDTGPLWRPALELNGLPCINKVLLYSNVTPRQRELG